MKRRRLKHQDFGLKIKSIDGDGTFSGLAACFNNIDLGNDKIVPGAFSRSLSGGAKRPLLWQHNPDEPIGTVTCVETPQGLQVQGELLMELEQAKSAYLLLKAGVIKGLSIGFDTIQESIEDGVRLLKELRLWECSIVTFPMNEAAAITAVKAMPDSDRAEHLKAIDGHRKAIDRHQRAIREHLKSMLDDYDDDESDSEESDDPALLEDDDVYDDPPDEGMSKDFLVEMRKLADLAGELAK